MGTSGIKSQSERKNATLYHELTDNDQFVQLAVKEIES